MRKTLEDLYYGNIIPNEQQMTPGSELKRAVDRVAKYEKQLMEQLEETEQETGGMFDASSLRTSKRTRRWN